MGIVRTLGALTGLLLVSLLALALALPPSAARADAILLPLEGDEALLPVHGAELRAAIVEELTARGERVRLAEDLVGEAELDGIHWCNDCIERLLRDRNAERAVIVALWGDEGAPALVSVTLLDRDSQPADAEVGVEGRTLREGLRAALEGALAAWPTRGGVPVRFVGSPEGAALLVDHYPFGTLPAEGRLAVGPHVVSVVVDGEVVARETFEVPASAAPFEVRLGGDDAASGPHEPGARDARAPREGRAWVAGPVVLAVGAGALLVEPIRGLAREGCADTVRGFCVAEERLDRGRAAAYLAASAGLAATAVVWGIVGRRRHRARAPRVELGALGATVRF